MRTLATAAALLLAATTACSSAQPPAEAVPVETPTASTPTATAPTPAVAAVGRMQTSSDADVDMQVTVLRLRMPFTPVVDGVLDRKGYVYAAIEVKVCLTRNEDEPDDPGVVSWAPWSLQWDSGIVAQAASSYSSGWWDEPLYPQDHIVRVGRCVRGWIPFEVRAKDGRPDRVLYTPPSLTPLEWNVA